MDRAVVRGGMRLVVLTLLFCGCEQFATVSSFAVQSVMLGWDPSTDPYVVGYNLYYGPSSQNYTNLVVAGDATNTIVSGLVEGVTYYFAATAYDSLGTESPFSNEVSYTIPTTNSPSTNDPPTITSIGNQVIQENSSTGPLPFFIGDTDTPVTNLSLAVVSSNPLLVPTADIELTGPGTNCSVDITPAANQSGTANITIVVSDNTGLSAATTFQLTVQPPVTVTSTPPTITAIGNQVIQENTATAPLSFTVGDAATPAANLIVSGWSSNPALVPESNFVFGGSGSNRTVQVTPASNAFGAVSISITVMDDSGNSAGTAFSLTVQSNVVTAPKLLVVITNGIGTITPNIAAQTLSPGKTYSVTANPAAGQLFTGWSGSFVSSSPKLTFTLATNTVLQANFIASPYLPVSGNYSGVFYNDSGVQMSSAGLFTASLTSGGTYSCRLQTAGGNYSCSGKLSLQCQISNVIKFGTNSLVLALQASQNTQGGQISGQLATASWSVPLQAGRATYDSKTNPAPFAGNYTMVIPGQGGSALLPSGLSYGTVHIASNGVSAFSGVLADGTKISQGFTVPADAQWPLFTGLYSGKGLLIGTPVMTPFNGDNFFGYLVWLKQTNANSKLYPSGFTMNTYAVGDLYNAPSGTNPVVALPSGQLNFSGGNLAASFCNLINIGAKSKITNLSSNKLAMTVTVNNGTYSGTVVDPTSGKLLPFGGVVMQNRKSGYGFLSGTNQCSQVFLTP